MKRKDITYRQVKITADRLFHSGENPTVDRVYELLKDVGTRKSIAGHLQKWWGETGKNGQEQITNDASMNINDESMTGEPNSQLLNQFAVNEENKKTVSLLRATLEATEDGILLVDRQGKFMDWNMQFMRLANLPPDLLEEADEESAVQYIFSRLKDPEELMKLMMRLAQNPEEKGDVGETHLLDGTILERYTQPLLVNGQIEGRVWSFRDVTQRRIAENELRLRNRAVEASLNGVAIVNNDETQTISYVNPAFAKITGFTPEEAVGQPLNFLQGQDSNAPHTKAVQLAFKNANEEQVILKSFRKDGTMFWNEMSIAPVRDENNDVTHFAVIVHDITERKAMEEQLIHQATHDMLTSLPNRALLQDRIQQGIVFAKRNQGQVAILFLDLDRFKNVNDSLGHKMGDELLRAVSERLKHHVREGDTVARLGGDEFIIVLSALHHEEDSIQMAQKLLNVLREPFHIEERDLRITTSIGVSRFPMDGHDADSLIRHADTAMYKAKDEGRDNFRFFTKDMNRQVMQRLQLENDLRIAIEEHQFFINYQPVTDLQDGHVVSAEALIRWNHPSSGLISPTEFIPLAEETGLILPIGEEVMENACRQAKAWQDSGLPKIQIAVNVSYRQLQHGNLTELVARVLHETQLPPECLVLELTESILMDRVEDTIGKLNELKNLGVMLAIDDFGTGFSSLSYIKQLPVDKIKIDRAFIHDLLSDPDDEAITLAIIAMAKSLNLEVVAEGAETSEVMDFLRDHHCDYAQGFYFSKPIEPQMFEKLLRESTGRLQ